MGATARAKAMKLATTTVLVFIIGTPIIKRCGIGAVTVQSR
jgi:predicted phosphoribosyltransferase